MSAIRPAPAGLQHLFHESPVLIGMVHLPALPGSPNYRGDFEQILAFARQEAETLAASGFSALLVENLGDHPYFPEHVPPVTVAAMAIVADQLRRCCGLPVGINVLRNDARAALAIAVAAQLSFLRTNVLAGVAVTDQGLVQGQAHVVLRERMLLRAEGVAIFADLRVKHAAPLVARDLDQEIEEFFERAMCSALIVSGTGSGKPVARDFLQRVKQAAGDRPVLLGSGLTVENAQSLLAIADGAIVGTSLKIGGKIQQPVDRSRAEALVRACRAHP